ncbi:MULTISPECIES: type II toxin-antitoxin system HigB family toxin [Dyadobacter]|uniref:type II toxin-antitoxin system HigB family toxin n=1 Tax=Dyadobacter TaxID=120831 RepID=UPI00286A71B9|nr:MULTISPECIES: type II toxin-antitoxin system HigB family toxin [Dyadobacter]
MRIITRGTLRDFWERYPDAEQELKYWHEKIRNADYQTANEVIGDNPRADTVGNNRIVFNICRNRYRLIALFKYQMQRVYIRFIGTHKDYDRITDTGIYEGYEDVRTNQKRVATDPVGSDLQGILGDN